MFIFFFFFFFFAHAFGIQKFPGEGLNLHHSNDPSHSSNNTGSLTTRPQGNFSIYFFMSHLPDNSGLTLLANIEEILFLIKVENESSVRKEDGSSHYGSAVTNPTSIHEVVGLIPGLAQ